MTIKLLKAHARQLDELSQKFEAAKSELASFLDDLASEWESEFAEKSEKWQEGENGQIAQERIDTVRGWFDELRICEPAIDSDSLGGRF